MEFINPEKLVGGTVISFERRDSKMQSILQRLKNSSTPYESN